MGQQNPLSGLWQWGHVCPSTKNCRCTLCKQWLHPASHLTWSDTYPFTWNVWCHGSGHAITMDRRHCFKFTRALTSQVSVRFERRLNILGLRIFRSPELHCIAGLPCQFVMALINLKHIENNTCRKKKKNMKTENERLLMLRLHVIVSPLHNPRINQGL